MLILTRRVQEVMRIGNDVTLKVLSVKGGMVRLGIEAPRDVEVHREEIYHMVKESSEGVSAEPAFNEYQQEPVVDNTRKPKITYKRSRRAVASA